MKFVFPTTKQEMVDLYESIEAKVATDGSSGELQPLIAAQSINLPGNVTKGNAGLVNQKARDNMFRYGEKTTKRHIQIWKLSMKFREPFINM